MSTTPNPKSLFGNRKAPVVEFQPPAPVDLPEAPPAPRLAALVETDAPLESLHGSFRPGYKDAIETVEHDGVVKTKHLLHGQRVRPFVHGEARGSERIIDSVRPLKGGAECEVTFLSPHAPEIRKAAYRWFDESWVGQPTDRVVQVPALVQVHS